MVTLDVLVVDDEPGMRLGVTRALRDFTLRIGEVNGDVQFTVTQASSAEQALELIDHQPPHILLLDQKLPGMSGLELLELLAPRQLETLTVMMTAYASIETAVKATKCGAYDFLAKPFAPTELKKVVAKAAEHLILSREARQLAREKRQMRFQFISVLGHELRAPLDAVEGYLHIVKNHSAGDDPALYDELLERCLTRTQFMRKMIVDLLDLTRIESGMRKRELTEVDVCEVAQEAIETAMPDAFVRELVLNLDAPLPVCMTADRSEIAIIFNNLVSNAVKYNRRGGRVDVRIREQGGEIEIAVTDTGIGLTPEEAARLFVDFVRIRNEKTQKIFGSGLGLSIVKKLATLYGGKTRVISTPDVGSTFEVTLKKNAPPPPRQK
ncbi:MAG: ATP-binding protein [FCB group bacterium]|nr:ATP-binding protein [FCB group bacterium]